MRKSRVWCLVVALLVVAGVNGFAESSHGPHWTYQGDTGPSHWGDLCPEWQIAKTGRQQSPVDIASVAPANLGAIEFSYLPGKLSVVNNGHTFKVNCTSDSYMRVNGVTYKLLQFHFHCPSENTVAGSPYPMEMHLVHKNAQGQLGVIGVFFEVGKANPVIDTVWKNIPQQVGHTAEVSGVTVDPASLLPANGSYWTFAGSLTTPPCSEGVSWFVMKEPLKISQAQADQLIRTLGRNARPTQPLYERTISEVTTGPLVKTHIAGFQLPSAPVAHAQPVRQSVAHSTTSHAAPVHSPVSPVAGHGRQGVSHSAVSVQAVPVSLADGETHRLLSKDWLTEADPTVEHYQASLSGAFWFCIFLLVVLALVGVIVPTTGVLDKLGLNWKLYISHGILALVAATLGTMAYFYLAQVVGVSSQAERVLEMDMMTGEMFATQNEFLLHGIENKEYGDKQVGEIHGVVSEFEQDLKVIETAGHIEDVELQKVREFAAAMKEYRKELDKVVSSSRDIRKRKESFDKQSELLDKNLEEMAEKHGEMLLAAEEKGDMNEAAYQARVVQHLDRTEALSRGAAAGFAQFMLDKKARHIGVVEQRLGKLKGYLKALTSEVRSQEERKHLHETERELELCVEAMHEIIKDEAKIMEETHKMKEQLHELEEVSANLATRLQERADKMEHEAELIAVILICMAVGLGALLSILVARSIAKPVRFAVDGMSRGAEQVLSASTQVSSSSQDMAEGASEQAASLEEISSSLEEMSSMTKQNADNAREADTMANEASSAANQGADAMHRMSDAINRIKDSSDETAKIIKTIDEIAFQTNLLALNAAVEAARAGDAGKGFAVVAEEVRNLAQRSAESAKNTADLIEASRSNSEDGVKAAVDVSELLEQIVDRVDKVAKLVAQVNAASSEQSKGIEQVNEAVTQLDQVTQSNAANAEESASASEELNAQADDLQNIVQSLVAVVEGNSHGGQALAHASHGSNRIRHVASASPARATKALPKHSNASKPDHGKKEISPEKVIPLNDSDFADF